jgi:hypothetical protein
MTVEGGTLKFNFKRRESGGEFFVEVSSPDSLEVSEIDPIVVKQGIPKGPHEGGGTASA